MEEIDLWRAAQLMIAKHGENAGIEAALKSDALLDQGDTKGADVWRRVLGIINRMEAERPDGAALN